jgi:hypothetical protein
LSVRVRSQHEKKPLTHTAPRLSGFQSRIFSERLGNERLGNVSGADATGANLDAPDGPVSEGLYFLNIRVPGLFGFIVGMAYVIPETRAFAAYFAYF